MSWRRRLVILAAAGAVAFAVAMAVFQPWLLFVDVTATDALPTVAPTVSPSATTTDESDDADPQPEGPVALASGDFVSHEHATSGTATIVQNPDGSRVLAIAGLDTSNGPDLHVWLSAADVVEGVDGWYTAGSAAYIDLGPLKGNLGDQVYEIPADADLSTIRGVDIWCVRFSVSFGAAPLLP
jgi:hypothetical protein